MSTLAKLRPLFKIRKKQRTTFFTSPSFEVCNTLNWTKNNNVIVQTLQYLRKKPIFIQKPTWVSTEIVKIWFKNILNLYWGYMDVV